MVAGVVAAGMVAGGATTAVGVADGAIAALAWASGFILDIMAILTRPTILTTHIIRTTPMDMPRRPPLRRRHHRQRVEATKVFFFEKKKQKTFSNLDPSAVVAELNV